VGFLSDVAGRRCQCSLAVLGVTSHTLSVSRQMALRASRDRSLTGLQQFASGSRASERI
jgi:hypothetical protein